MAKNEVVAKPVQSTRPEEQIDRFVGLIGGFRALMAMIRDPEYRFPLRVKVAVVLSIVYLVTPIDVIPEAIFLFFGLADDLALLGATAYMVNTEVQAYIARQREMTSAAEDESPAAPLS
ncbi:DUF1232 domain-containing protein [bacterium]|nr:DUF1232 domain-containing protein [bacterium]